MIRVFFIINSYTAGVGAEALLTTIVNALDHSKYDIGIMEIIHYPNKIEKVHESVKIYPYFVEADAPDRKQRMYSVYHEWDKVIEQYIPDDYDIYISFNYLKPSFLLPPDKKGIAWIHGDLYNLNTEKFTEEKELQRQAFANVDRIVAISDITHQSIMDLYPEYMSKVVDIYNGIDTKRVIEMSKQDCSVRLEDKSILAVGRLDKNKDPMHLLRVFNGVHQKCKEAHLYYLGYGPLEDEVNATAAEMGINQYVHTLGYYENPFPVIRQCKVVAMLSVSEGFPMALLEAVSLGKPFVSTVVGGSRILADGQRCGKVTDDDALIEQYLLEYLNGDSEEAKKACAESIKRFDMKNYIKRIEDLIEEVLKES